MTDKELKEFEDDLLQSIREMKAKQYAGVHQVNVTEISKTRVDLGMSQRAFAELMGVSVRTLQEWEQGRRKPTGAAQTLLRIAKLHPTVLRDLTAN